MLQCVTERAVPDVAIDHYSILFHWHVHNATIPCRSQELLPFLPVIYFFLLSFFFSLPCPQTSSEDTFYTQVVIPTEDTTTEAANSIGVHVTST
jgi:hypothetical protein